MKNKTLILSIALNGYQWMYRTELQSHLQYANKYGYVHQAVTKPYVSALGVECCWLKLTLMRTALLSGYDTVLFLDADTMVNAHCPAVTQVFEADKYIYMAKGYSVRFYSGVLIERNNPQTVNWVSKVINARFCEVKSENDVGWGENGHVIELSKGVPFIVELDKKWNNTADNQLKDYIRHRNCGPLRTGFINNFFHKIVFYLSANLLTLVKRYQHLVDYQQSECILLRETKKIISIYPKISL
jgi:hypothetical protein